MLQVKQVCYYQCRCDLRVFDSWIDLQVLQLLDWGSSSHLSSSFPINIDKHLVRYHRLLDEASECSQCSISSAAMNVGYTSSLSTLSKPLAPPQLIHPCSLFQLTHCNRRLWGMAIFFDKYINYYNTPWHIPLMGNILVCSNRWQDASSVWNGSCQLPCRAWLLWNDYWYVDNSNMMYTINMAYNQSQWYTIHRLLSQCRV